MERGFLSLRVKRSGMLGRYLGKYNDILLGAVLIPVINTINYHLTYGHIRWDWYTAATYSIDTVSGYISWWIIRASVIWLDRAMPYEKGFMRRILTQIGLTTLAVLAFTIAATEGVNALYWDKPLPSKFYTYNLFIIFIWILVIDGIYVGLYFFDQWQRTQNLREKDRTLRQAGYKVRQGRQVLTLPFPSIGAFHTEDGQTYLTTFEGKRFALDLPLNKIEPLLPGESFFRVNRKYILNRELISGYLREPYGKLQVRLSREVRLPELPVISRLTAPGFKAWFEQAVQKG